MTIPRFMFWFCVFAALYCGGMAFYSASVGLQIIAVFNLFCGGVLCRLSEAFAEES